MHDVPGRRLSLFSHIPAVAALGETVCPIEQLKQAGFQHLVIIWVNPREGSPHHQACESCKGLYADRSPLSGSILSSLPHHAGGQQDGFKPKRRR
jgi:hypothetical protein